MDGILSPNARPFEMDGGEHGVLLIHGFTGSPAHMRLIGEDLAEEGFSVRGILLPGHGTKPGDMKNVGWQDWVHSVRMAAREMRKTYRHFSVAGLSMGGVLALLLAEEMDVDACITLAAPLRIFNPFRRLALLASPFLPMTEKKENPRRSLLNAAYDIGYDRYPTKSVHDLNVLMDRAEKDLSLIDCPVLCIQSKMDETVKLESVGRILQGVGSRVKGELWLETSPHVCTITDERPLVSKAMIAFLRKAEESELTRQTNV